jgi:hypothetical protein
MRNGLANGGRRAAFVTALAMTIAAAAGAAHAQQAAPPPPAVSSQPAPTAPPAYAPPAAYGAAPSLKGPSVWGILPWGGLGVGARFMIPLGIPPLLANTALRDSFNLEFGADLLHWSYDYGSNVFNYSWTEVLPVVGMMWNIWLNQSFALYPKIELGYAFGWFSGWDNAYGANEPVYGGFFWDGAAGALYKLNNGLTLRAEIGVAGLKLGAGWLF